MATKRPDDRSPLLPFSTPPGFGEPVGYLIIAVNAQGQPHFHLQGSGDQALFLATQGLNYAISHLVVASLQQSLERAALTWPQAIKEGHS